MGDVDDGCGERERARERERGRGETVELLRAHHMYSLMKDEKTRFCEDLRKDFKRS